MGCAEEDADGLGAPHQKNEVDLVIGVTGRTVH